MDEKDKCPGCEHRDDEIRDLRQRLQHAQEQLRHAETARDAMSNLHVVEPVTETPELDDKQEKMLDFIRSFRALEDAMEPYKEQKRELRKDFKDQGWLTKDEISMTTKAYRMMNTKNFDMDEFTKILDTLTTVAGRN